MSTYNGFSWYLHHYNTLQPKHTSDRLCWLAETCKILLLLLLLPYSLVVVIIGVIMIMIMIITITGDGTTACIDRVHVT